MKRTLFFFLGILLAVTGAAPSRAQSDLPPLTTPEGFAVPQPGHVFSFPRDMRRIRSFGSSGGISRAISTRRMAGASACRRRSFAPRRRTGAATFTWRTWRCWM